MPSTARRSRRCSAHERVLRPLNVGEEVPGRGTLTLAVAGENVRVVVLADREALDFAPPFARMTLDAYAAWSALPPGPTTIVDMHAQSVAAKQALAYALDGQVAAVLGTHSHEPTLPLHLLAGGTAFVTDVGMTGPSGGPQGMDAQGVVARVRGLLADRAATWTRRRRDRARRCPARDSRRPYTEYQAARQRRVRGTSSHRQMSQLPRSPPSGRRA